jgi:hypothetical protein
MFDAGYAHVGTAAFGCPAWAKPGGADSDLGSQQDS